MFQELKAKLNNERFNLIDLIFSYVKDYRNRLEGSSNNNSVKLICNQLLEGDIVLVDADLQRVSQVISNLLSNAVKFTKDGGAVSVTVKKNEDEEEEKQDKGNQKFVVVSVTDTGTCIDPQIFPRLFEKFASRSFQGTGLGLFLSKGIVEAHGGKIWAENNASGKGARFSFILPIVAHSTLTNE
jgi:signal transduction histidine kinase